MKECLFISDIIIYLIHLATNSNITCKYRQEYASNTLWQFVAHQIVYVGYQISVDHKPFCFTKTGNHLDDHNILFKFQHGFRYLHLCQTQLMITLKDLRLHRANNSQINMAILDISKAFDTLPHHAHDSLLK